ncbi:hypothetical protein T459_18784 [Capsicum annuum]|uniref:Uncharacterized protein n=1 Tax=Capsicum annuum TaxID=4072 RepID=A0A2G2YZS6_CAPAN|nr:hypothetical protein T459_18784 [Capsicum annuum]
MLLLFNSRFTIEVDVFIRDWTMITEYVRDVDYLNNREADDGDSTMTLLSTNNTSKDLVICLDKRNNIARFINNKHLKSGNTRFVECASNETLDEVSKIRNAAHQTRSEHQATVNVSPNQATHEDGTSRPTMDQAGTDEEEDGRQGRMKKKMYLLRQRMKMATASPC